MKKEFQIISELIKNNSRVLDVGCGDGILMKHLKDTKKIDTRGLEISKNNVQICISKGLSVIEGNAEKDLQQFPSLSFDYVILSQTLQAFYNPEKVINDLLKISNKAKSGKIIIFDTEYSSSWEGPVVDIEAKPWDLGIDIFGKCKPGDGSIGGMNQDLINSKKEEFLFLVRDRKGFAEVWFTTQNIYCWQR